MPNSEESRETGVGGGVLGDRAEKRAELERRGVTPYAYRYDVDRTAVEARRAFEQAEENAALEDGDGPEVRLGGRLVAIRRHGKSSFADLEDRSGEIQLYFRLDEVGEERYDLLDLLDIGDWIGIQGPLIRTRMGEVTVRVASFELLAKSLRPLPIGKEEVDEETGERRVHSGFADVEQRYRQRYADLAVHRDVREVFRTRSRIISAARRFLDERDYVEVETPVLQPLYGGASAEPFRTHHRALDLPLYLRIADELYLKRLIVGGLERVYEIGKDFRNEGMDRMHNPEFTMLELYQAFADYEDVMGLVEKLLVELVREVTGGALTLEYQGVALDFEPPFRRLRYMDALRQYGDLAVEEMDEGALREAVRSLGVTDAGRGGRAKLLDALFGELVEPHLDEPVFIVDYPRELSPLAKPKRGNPDLAERFELHIAGHEIANAFSELNDPLDQRERLRAQARLREAGDVEALGYDEDYIRAMEYGMPPTGGVGIGMDRLVMLLTDAASIRDVILFPTMRPE